MMDAIALLRRQTRASWDWLEMTVGDVRPEMANWQPPGRANSIAATYAHLLISADFDLNSRLYGGMPLFASVFKGNVGLSEMHLGGFDWQDWAIRLRADWEALRQYGRAVHARMVERMESLAPAELELRADMSAHGLGIWSGLDIYNLHGWDHPKLHGGEIACLKGLQGERGWSQGPVHRG